LFKISKPLENQTTPEAFIAVKSCVTHKLSFIFRKVEKQLFQLITKILTRAYPTNAILLFMSHKFLNLVITYL